MITTIGTHVVQRPLTTGIENQRDRDRRRGAPIVDQIANQSFQLRT